MTTTTVRGAADVLALMPYTLGYQPSDCVVLVCVRDGLLGLTERLDLPPVERVASACSALLEPVLRHDAAEGVLLIGYETHEGDSLPLLTQLGDAVVEAGIDLLDTLVVRDGRWFTPTCTGSCCPGEGTPLPAPADTPAVSEFVARGVSPLPDRDAVADLVRPDERAALAGALVGSLGRGGSGEGPVLDLWRRLTDVDAAPVRVAGAARDHVVTASEALLLARSLRDVVFRDALIGRILPDSLRMRVFDRDVRERAVAAVPLRPWWSGPDVDLLTADELLDLARAALGPDGEDVDDLTPEEVEHLAVELLSLRATVDGLEGGGAPPDAQTRDAAFLVLVDRLLDLVRALPEQEAAPALTLLADVSWWRGDGALARSAIDRALEVEPDYRLAQLIGRLLDFGVRARTPR
ncbi:DUF4192 domain-containing protein [Janibacter sp. G56]|uniref:DUF4192 domain-containing protein n=1 Tax=Janibacter sp. G56 TaxID=3418717 RepID=UPI003D00CF1A